MSTITNAEPGITIPGAGHFIALERPDVPAGLLSSVA
jgi:hypothetical protein